MLGMHQDAAMVSRDIKNVECGANKQLLENLIVKGSLLGYLAPKVHLSFS
jgi:hypothetical protein